MIATDCRDKRWFKWAKSSTIILLSHILEIGEIIEFVVFCAFVSKVGFGKVSIDREELFG